MDNADIIYEQAGKYYDAGDFSKTISICSDAISKGVRDARIYNTRAFAYIRQGEILKARSDLSSSLNLDPTDSWVREQLAKLNNI